MAQTRKAARRLIEEAYETAADIQNVNLEAVNAPRRPNLRYQTQFELVREFLERANAIMQFAGDLGLITPDEARALLITHGRTNPELEAFLMKPR
jgi:hypothetical protein